MLCSHFSDNLFLVTVRHALEVQLLPGEYLNSYVSPVTGRGRLWLGLAYQTVRLPLHFSNYAEGSIADDVQRFVEVQQRRHGVGSRGEGYVGEWVDEPLEEVGDVEGNSRVLLNFVESDGLSRVRVCHVAFTPFILGRRPYEF